MVAPIESIVLRMGARLDWAMVEAELQPLCEVKEAPDILARLSTLRARTETDPHRDGGKQFPIVPWWCTA